jgi:hypothetical protein
MNVIKSLLTKTNMQIPKKWMAVGGGVALLLVIGLAVGLNQGGMFKGSLTQLGNITDYTRELAVSGQNLNTALFQMTDAGGTKYDVMGDPKLNEMGIFTSTRAGVSMNAKALKDSGYASVYLKLAPVVVADTTAPVLAEVRAIGASRDQTPAYTFSSSEAGTITYGGSCSSVTTAAIAGNNSVVFNKLADGEYSNCTIMVKDAAGNASAVLPVSTFSIAYYAGLPVVDTTAAVLTEVTPINTTRDQTPDYTFNSTKAGTITYGGACSSSTTAAIAGNNTVTFNNLPNATYTNCTISVKNSSGNTSNTLAVSAFNVNYYEAPVVVADTTAPVLAEVTPIGLTRSYTPQYIFSSSEAGTISTTGSCSLSSNSAVAGNNTVTLNSLPDGDYCDCQLTVRDASGNTSTALNITRFRIDYYGTQTLDILPWRCGTINVRPVLTLPTTDPLLVQPSPILTQPKLVVPRLTTSLMVAHAAPVLLDIPLDANKVFKLSTADFTQVGDYQINLLGSGLNFGSFGVTIPDGFNAPAANITPVPLPDSNPPATTACVNMTGFTFNPSRIVYDSNSAASSYTVAMTAVDGTNPVDLNGNICADSLTKLGLGIDQITIKLTDSTDSSKFVKTTVPVKSTRPLSYWNNFVSYVNTAGNNPTLTFDMTVEDVGGTIGPMTKGTVYLFTLWGDNTLSQISGNLAIVNNKNTAIVTKETAVADQDQDGVADALDNCPALANRDQLDTDRDRIGDVCDPVNNSAAPVITDQDQDGVADASDNCPALSNSTQLDSDNDRIGDACDTVNDNNTAVNAATKAAADAVAAAEAAKAAALAAEKNYYTYYTKPTPTPTTPEVTKPSTTPCVVGDKTFYLAGGPDDPYCKDLQATVGIFQKDQPATTPQVRYTTALATMRIMKELGATLRTKNLSGDWTSNFVDQDKIKALSAQEQKDFQTVYQAGVLQGKLVDTRTGERRFDGSSMVSYAELLSMFKQAVVNGLGVSIEIKESNLPSFLLSECGLIRGVCSKNKDAQWYVEAYSFAVDFDLISKNEFTKDTLFNYATRADMARFLSRFKDSEMLKDVTR